MADSSLNVIVRLKDDASAGLKQFANNVDSAGKSIQETTAGAQTFTKVIAGVTAVVAGYALKTFADFEKTMSGVKAVLTPTTAEFAELSEKVKQVGKDTIFTQSEIARTVEELGKQGLTSRQILDGALDATTALASATGTDLANAATVAADTMNVFNKKASDMKDVVNQITGVANLSKLSVQDYSYALSMGGGVAKQFGVDFKEFNAVIASTANYFQGGSDQGTSFKQFLMNLTPTTKKASELMQKLGFSAYDASGKMKSIPEVADALAKSLRGLSEEQRNWALKILFGSDSARMAGAIAEQGAAGIKKMMAEIAKTDAAEQARIRLDNFWGSLEKLKGTLDVMATTLGAKIAGFLKPVIDGLTDALDDMSGWWENLSPVMQTVLTVVGSVTAALTGLMLVVGSVGIAFAVATPAITAIIGALTFLLSPIGLVIAAVIALGTAFATNFLGFRDAVIGAWNMVQPLFAAIGNGIIALSATVWSYVAKMIEPLQKIWEAVSPYVFAFGESLSAAFGTIFEGLVQWWTATWQVIEGVVKAALALVLGAVTVFLQVITGDWQGAWATVQQVTTDVGNGINQAFQGFLSMMQAAWTTFSKLFSSSWTILWNGLLTLVTNMKNSILSLVSSLWDGIIGFFTDGAAVVTQGWTGFANGLGNIMTGVWEGIKNTIAAGINWVIDKINSAIESINSATDTVGIPKIPSIPRVKFQDGGVVPGQYESGGIVPGGKNPANHDLVPALLDPGELILNRAQQFGVATALSSGAATPAYVVNVSVSGNSFFGSDSDFAEKIGDVIFERFNRHQAIPSF